MSGTGPEQAAMEQARRFAALSAPFDPARALAAAGLAGAAPLAVARVASDLARRCETRLPGADARWLLLPGPRRDIIAALTREKELANAIAWRRTLGTDPGTDDLLDALTGTGLFAPRALRALASRAMRAPAPDLAEPLRRAAATFGLLGTDEEATAAVRDLRAKVGIALARVVAAGRRGEEAPFIGRDAALAEVARWLAAPATFPVRTLLLCGPAGIGKSTLLDRAVVQACAERPRTLVVRLDFDRAGLDMVDPPGLTLELARQVASSLPAAAAAIRALRVDGAGQSRDQTTRGERPDSLPARLSAALAEAFRKANAASRPLLVAIDTAEALRGRGATHPARLRDWLESLPQLGLSPPHVIAAGRDDAFRDVPDFVGEKISIAGFGAEEARLFLDRMGADDRTRALVATLSAPGGLLEALAGNPLMLRVATQALQEEATGEGAAGERAERNPERAIARALVDRILLSRIADPTLKALVFPGLVVRWVHAGFVHDALAPALGVALDGPAHAELLLGALSRQQWLCETGFGVPWVRIRPEARAVLLPLFYRLRARRCACVNRAAAHWFEAQSDPWLKVEATYHRLQLVRAGAPAPEIGPDISARLGATTLAEIPLIARIAVPQMAVRMDSAAIVARKWAAARSAAVDHSGACDLRAFMERADWAEAALVFRREFAGRALDPASEAADAARSFLWRSGQWEQALGLLADAGRPDDADLADLRLLDLMVRLEMRAEFAFDHLAARLAAGDAAGEGLRRAVARIPLTGAASDLTAGALGFCLAAAGAPRPAVAAQVADPVGAALDLWSLRARGGVRTARVLQAVAVAGEQRRRCGFAPLSPDAGGMISAAACARALASLSPYGASLQQAVLAVQDGTLQAQAQADLQDLRGAMGARLGLVPLKEALGLPVAAQSPVRTLRDLGLVAEWGWIAGAGAPGNVALITAAAERFRATVAGRWSYGASPPVGWAGFEGGPGDVLAAALTACAPPTAEAAEASTWTDIFLRAAAVSAGTPAGSAAATQAEAQLRADQQGGSSDG